MAGLVVVQGDPVAGTDTHNVTGTGPNPNQPPVPPEVPYTGVGDFSYLGQITGELSDFVRIGGRPVALVTSRSSLDPGQDTPPEGKHWGPQGSNFVGGPPVQPTKSTLSITDKPLGTGVPSAGAGSGLLTVNEVKVLLDSNAIDTCSGVQGLAGSTVTVRGQDFVTCSQ